MPRTATPPTPTAAAAPDYAPLLDALDADIRRIRTRAAAAIPTPPPPDATRYAGAGDAPLHRTPLDAAIADIIASLDAIDMDAVRANPAGRYAPASMRVSAAGYGLERALYRYAGRNVSRNRWG